MANAIILNELIAALNTNINAFEKAIKTGATTVRNAIARQSQLKLDIVEKIITAYPNVNRQWLTGVDDVMFIYCVWRTRVEVINYPAQSGETIRRSLLQLQMLDNKNERKKNNFDLDKNPNLSAPSGEEKKYNDAVAFDLGKTETTKSGNVFIEAGDGMYVMLVPLVHEYAYGGYLKGFADPEYIGELPKHSIMVTAKHKGIYRTFAMRGDSMDNGLSDSIQSGDKVTGRLVDKSYWSSKLHLHKFKEFIIHHKDGIIIKEIVRHDVENGIIIIHSKNPDKLEYPDAEIKLADCLELYNVIEVSKTRG